MKRPFMKRCLPRLEEFRSVWLEWRDAGPRARAGICLRGRRAAGSAAAARAEGLAPAAARPGPPALRPPRRAALGPRLSSVEMFADF